MTREIAHQKMFEAALAAIEPNFPPGKLPGDEKIAHVYFKDSVNGKGEAGPGVELVSAFTDWGFDVMSKSQGGEPELPDPKPSVESASGPASRPSSAR